MIASLVAGVLTLVPLHRVDGHLIYINPSEVISLTEPRPTGDPKKTTVPGTRCIVFLGSKHFFAVQETCAEVVKLLLEEKAR